MCPGTIGEYGNERPGALEKVKGPKFVAWMGNNQRPSMRAKVAHSTKRETNRAV